MLCSKGRSTLLFDIVSYGALEQLFFSSAFHLLIFPQLSWEFFFSNGRNHLLSSFSLHNVLSSSTFLDLSSYNVTSLKLARDYVYITVPQPTVSSHSLRVLSAATFIHLG